MGCFPFSKGDKEDEHKNTKPISIDSSRSSFNVSIFSERDPKRSESDFSSQNISDTSIDFEKRSLHPSFPNRRSNLRDFRFQELKAVTKNFNRSNLLGEGGFGCVYRGLIKNSEDPSKKLDVAVKKLNGGGWQGHREWITEVNVLGVAEHPNLVKLVGYCAEDDERGTQRLLVYEYMPNLSVEHHLLSQTETPLPWSMRLKIAQDSARGLVYLHEDMEFQIIFRDFKPSNILLDEQWNAKLSDFGLARLGPTEGLTHISTAAVGTFGYAAPEYLQTGRLTSKNDVYSYGVFLYVLITGRHPLDRMRPKAEQKLLEWIRPYLTDAKKFRTIVDPRLEGNYSLKSVQKVANLASQCLTRQPKSRPKMSEVLENINQIVDESAGTGTPQLDPKKSSEMAQVESFKNNRKILDMKSGENSWFSWIWRPKV